MLLIKLHLLLTIGILSLSFLSCKKPEETPAKEVRAFKKIVLNGNTDITLVQAGSNTVISTTLEDSQYAVSDETLNISGNGTITVGVSDLNSINVISGNLLTSGTVVYRSCMFPLNKGFPT